MPPSRILVLCDGTGSDATAETRDEAKDTNIGVMRRLIPSDGDQLVLYYSGIGTTHYASVKANYAGGTIGVVRGWAAATAEMLKNYWNQITADTEETCNKIAEAYMGIVENYEDGVELFFGGFSRGAFTARMLLTLISIIGIVPKNTSKEEIVDIVKMLNLLGNTRDVKERQKLIGHICNWPPRKLGRARLQGPTPQDVIIPVKALAMFDMVPSVGYPKTLTQDMHADPLLWGFHNKEIEANVESVFHAISIDESRLDFQLLLPSITQTGKAAGQTIVQAGFRGDHGDVGGGEVKEKDLTYHPLLWMCEQLQNSGLQINTEAVADTVLNPSAPWGTHAPQGSRSGLYRFTRYQKRSLPKRFDDPLVNFHYHRSVAENYIPEESRRNTGCYLKLSDEERRTQTKWRAKQPDAPSSSSHLPSS